MVNSILFPSTTVTTSGNTGAGTSLPANTRGAIFNVNVSAISGTTPAMVLSLQWFDPASQNWITLASMSSINATGGTLAIVYPGASNPLYNVLPSNYRIAWAVTGTNPSITFSIGVNYLN